MTMCSTRDSVRSRFLVGIVTIAALGVVMLLAFYGTDWVLRRRGANSARYEMLAAWDGAGVPGGLQRPIGIAVSSDDSIYVTDSRRQVVHLSAAGEFVAEFGGEGNGPGEFGNAVGIAVALDGSVFVSDFDLDRVQKFTPDGKFLFQFGRAGSGAGQFNSPAGIALDQTGAIYVADFYNHRIQRFRADGSFEKRIGWPGRIADGALHYPTDVAVSSEGQLVVADAYNYQLQGFSLDGKPLGRAGYHLLWLWPRPASGDAGFNVPTGIAIAADGLVHVADSANHRVILLDRKRRFLTDWKIPDANPNIYSPEKVALSHDGRTLYATDFATNRILVLRVVPPANHTAQKIFVDP
jgi:tripartite motif-containing protein 71